MSEVEKLEFEKKGKMFPSEIGMKLGRNRVLIDNLFQVIYLNTTLNMPQSALKLYDQGINIRFQDVNGRK